MMAAPVAPPDSAVALLQQARRVVVKVGSSLVTNDGHGLDAAAIDQWCQQIVRLTKQPTSRGLPGRELIWVSSGAVAEGLKRLGWRKRPHEVHELQAAAAVGQMGLVQMYESTLQRHGLLSAQVLLTHADMEDRQRYLNARSTLLTLLRRKVLPIINENDTVVTDDIKVGDNDTLGALVANLVEADLLVILTDQRGLYSADPRRDPGARFVAEASAGDPALERMAGGVGSGIGTGGMLTKILAAKRASRSGASTVIANGREPQALLRLLDGENIGTLLRARTHKIQARKQWIADHLQVHGQLYIDAGAVSKLLREGKSLLPVGVTRVSGLFLRGDAVAICDEAGAEVARGLVGYSSAEAMLLLRKPSSEIESLLGYSAGPELVHRDNLVLTAEAGSRPPQTASAVE